MVRPEKLDADAGGGGTLARVIRALRERAMLTQEELAKRSCLSVGTIRGLEAGRIHRPRTGTVRMLVSGLALGEHDGLALLVAARQPADTGPVPAIPTAVVPAQLPADLATFTGRDDALRALDDTLPMTASAPLVQAIVGTAGIGKTALAVHWAHRVSSVFPDGQLYVDLRGFGPDDAPMDPTEALRGFVDALQTPPHRIPTDPQALAGLYRSLLAGRRVLVLLDNARDSQQVRTLLPGSFGCMAVVTSRNHLLNLATSAGAQLLLLGQLSPGEAREMLVRRLSPRRAAAELDAVDDIVALCAGLPLALATVAARASYSRYPLNALADQLRDRRKRLDALKGEDQATDLRAVFSWSYRTLTPEAAWLFRLLGRHLESGFPTSAVASLVAMPPFYVRSLLAELAYAHLIDEYAPGRYALPGLLDLYAEELSYATDPEPRPDAGPPRYD